MTNISLRNHTEFGAFTEYVIRPDRLIILDFFEIDVMCNGCAVCFIVHHHIHAILTTQVVTDIVSFSTNRRGEALCQVIAFLRQLNAKSFITCNIFRCFEIRPVTGDILAGLLFNSIGNNRLSVFSGNRGGRCGCPVIGSGCGSRRDIVDFENICAGAVMIGIQCKVHIVSCGNCSLIIDDDLQLVSLIVGFVKPQVMPGNDIVGFYFIVKPEIVSRDSV